MTEAISSVQQLEDAVAAVLPNDSRAELFFTRARDIVSDGFVKDLTVNSTTKAIAANVSSATQAWKQHYIVTCCLSSTSAADPRFVNSCSCPQHELTGVCKHSIALALTQLLPGGATKAAQETAAQPSQPARCVAAQPAAVVKQSAPVPAESAAAAQHPNDSVDQPSLVAAAGRPASSAGAGAAGVPSAAARPPAPKQTQNGMLSTQHGTQLTQGGSRKLPASLRRPAASKPVSSPVKQTQTRPSQTAQPKLKQALLKRPAARTAGRAAQAPAAAAAGPSAAGQRSGSRAKTAAAAKSSSRGLTPFQASNGQRHVRMDGTTILQVEDAQLLAQCRKVLAAEEVSARSDVTAVLVSQPSAAQPATQHAQPHGQQAAQLAGGPQYPQFTLPPSRDPDATIPVELSEDTRQRRAALILQREGAGPAAPPVAPSEAVTADGGSAQQRSSASTQQPVARKAKPSLLDSLLGPSQVTQASQQPAAASSQPDSVPVRPPAAAAAATASTPQAAPGGVAGPPRPSVPQKKKSLFDVMLG